MSAGQLILGMGARRFALTPPILYRRRPVACVTCDSLRVVAVRDARDGSITAECAACGTGWRLATRDEACDVEGVSA